MPAERVKALRTAFDETMRDPDFLADAKKLGVDIDGPLNGEAVAKIVAAVSATPKEIVEQVKALQNGGH
jgi:tripartite-type tricarboxylate transporter receptor subunit TctC